MRVRDILENLSDDPFTSKEEELAYLKEKKEALQREKQHEEGPLLKVQSLMPGKILSYAGTDRVPDKVREAPSAYEKFDLNSYHATPVLVKHPIQVSSTVRYWVPRTEPMLVHAMGKLVKKISMLSYKIAEIEVQEYKLLINDVRMIRKQRAEERKTAREQKSKNKV